MTDRTCYWDERGGICPHEPHEHCPNENIEPCENQCELCKAETINREVTPMTDKMTIEQAIELIEDLPTFYDYNRLKDVQKAVTMAIEALKEQKVWQEAHKRP